MRLPSKDTQKAALAAAQEAAAQWRPFCCPVRLIAYRHHPPASLLRLKRRLVRPACGSSAVHCMVHRTAAARRRCRAPKDVPLCTASSLRLRAAKGSHRHGRRLRRDVIVLQCRRRRVTGDRDERSTSIWGNGRPSCNSTATSEETSSRTAGSRRLKVGRPPMDALTDGRARDAPPRCPHGVRGGGAGRRKRTATV